MAAQQSQYLGPGSCQESCTQTSTSPCCIGQWSGPFNLNISCPDCVGGFPCGDPHHWDEIAHAALIPWGGFWEEDPTNPGNTLPVGGKVLIWTTCDDDELASQEFGYRTHVIDAMAAVPYSVWSPPILEVLAPLPAGRQQESFGPLDRSAGIFCSGHTWMLDDQLEPKLLVVGGVEHGSDCEASFAGNPCALSKSYWFDPKAPTPDDAWSDFPDDLGDRNWYPSVITYRESAVDGNTNDKFSPIAFGGSGLRPPSFGCATAGVVSGETIEYQYNYWWTRSAPYAESGGWDKVGIASYLWQQYPRTLWMSDETIFSVGSATVCEVGWNQNPTQVNAKAVAQYGTTDAGFGGNPVHEIEAGTMTRSNPVVSSPTLTGGWVYANAVLMHTLKNTALYDTNPNLSNYDLDRVIIHGGSIDLVEDVQGSGTTDGLNIVREWDGTQLGLKADASKDRVYSSMVALPDGSLLVMGGREKAIEPKYVDQVERFWPGTPSSLGVWEQMAPRAFFGGSPLATPRGYHSVALLLQNGSVALMGGRHEQDMDYTAARSRDSIEVFKPPYMFETDRLRITGGIPTMHYGDEIAFKATDSTRVAYACLIGLGSVTHHFDYGARYVELMTLSSGTKDVKAWIPSDPDLLPEGMYQLYVVEERPLLGGGHVRIPSTMGRFVKVTF